MIHRLTKNEFHTDIRPTIGVQLANYTSRINSDTMMTRGHIWDISGRNGMCECVFVSSSLTSNLYSISINIIWVSFHVCISLYISYNIYIDIVKVYMEL
jgi:hypothetical protein